MFFFGCFFPEDGVHLHPFTIHSYKCGKTNRYQLPCKYLINGFPLNFSHPYIGGVNFTPYLFSLVLFVPGPTTSRNVASKSRWATICLTSTMTRTAKAGGRTPGDAGWDGGVLVPGQRPTGMQSSNDSYFQVKIYSLRKRRQFHVDSPGRLCFCRMICVVYPGSLLGDDSNFLTQSLV